MLEERACLVTGAASGIGRATALEMARQGARGVGICDVDVPGGEETAEEVRALGATAIFSRCDVRRPADIQAAVEAVAAGLDGIDVLHNNAGIHESALTDRLSVDDLPLEVWDAVYETNLRSVWLFMQHAAPYLRRSSRSPAVINAASTGGVTGFPMMNAYGASKAGVIQLTRTAAVDFAPQARVNCYCPASVDTPMVRRFLDVAPDPDAALRESIATQLIPRMGRPEEIAKLVCYLASEDAAWITGASIAIDGGTLAWRGQRQ